MGVSGAGKTTVGKLLGEELGWKFVDGDDYHSAANVKKMRAGIPLTDSDRAPWLMTLQGAHSRLDCGGRECDSGLFGLEAEVSTKFCM